MGYRFETLQADVEEQPRPAETPDRYALRIARAKALAGLQLAPAGELVLSADTDVVLDGAILGKPLDVDDALRMLRALSDRTHQVFSAVAVARGDRVETALVVTEVTFGPIDEADAQAYCRSGESMGKAGGYAIQGVGAGFVKEIRGSYSGVVGLPLFETRVLLRAFGVNTPIDRAGRSSPF
jgi:septum formation protein